MDTLKIFSKDGSLWAMQDRTVDELFKILMDNQKSFGFERMALANKVTHVGGGLGK
jgi:hypothetical protein